MTKTTISCIFPFDRPGSFFVQPAKDTKIQLGCSCLLASIRGQIPVFICGGLEKLWGGKFENLQLAM